MSHDDEAKRSRIAQLFMDRPARATTQEIRDRLYEVIRQALDSKNIETLALLAAWFVLASDNTTIARFKMWLEQERIHDQAQAPSNGKRR
jgi:hypothetical protein